MLYAATVSAVVAWVLTATNPTGSIEDYLLGYGPLGIVLLLVVMDKIGTHSERNRLREENAALRDELRLANEITRRDILPPLIKVTELLPQVVERLTSRRGSP